ncbi:hypothetical protein BCV70DRAFT_118389 [Testicularia cyperi]|uniref:Uncharacterized protein n=1 Tax=Testicularia cyperi TaxID=1882483 RepID=A0A317XM64_9BASI|nr:hypothetical protein BCV70DRAFT_118389 [Testicularia cyperi]
MDPLSAMQLVSWCAKKKEPNPERLTCDSDRRRPGEQLTKVERGHAAVFQRTCSSERAHAPRQRSSISPAPHSYIKPTPSPSVHCGLPFCNFHLLPPSSHRIPGSHPTQPNLSSGLTLRSSFRVLPLHIPA